LMSSSAVNTAVKTLLDTKKNRFQLGSSSMPGLSSVMVSPLTKMSVSTMRSNHAVVHTAYAAFLTC